MDLDRSRFLVSPIATTALLDEAQLAALPLHIRASKLRESLAPSEAAAISEQVDLRSRMLERTGVPARHRRLTRPGLEMATHPLVARRRAHRLAALDMPVADLTCGIGGDLEALSEAAQRVVGVERDPAVALLAAHNAPAAIVVRGDALRPPLDPRRFALFLDPARRSATLRRFDPASFEPAWDASVALLEEAPAGALKGPPGLHDAAIPTDAELEFVQLGRGLRESALYLGGDARPGLRRAVLLPAGHELASDEPEADLTTVPLGGVLYDPASAVTRAGVVRQLAHALGANLLDRHLGYLSSVEPRFSPFADTFAVLDVIPFSVARVKKYLRETRRVPHEIRRRAFPVEPDELRRQLGPIEGDPVTLMCTTIDGQRLVIVTRRLDSNVEIA